MTRDGVCFFLDQSAGFGYHFSSSLFRRSKICLLAWWDVLDTAWERYGGHTTLITHPDMYF